jgi:hypothetical protein
MDKCWFVLRQAHYPAPAYVHPGMARGEAVGPILLGHIIPSLKELDQTVNSDGPLPFPRDMRIWPTTMCEFRWLKTTQNGIETYVKAGAPILAPAGVTIKGDVGLAFQRTVGDFWDFDRLDTQIVQPTRTYIDQCLKSDPVSSFVDKHKFLNSWSLCMISGLMIARGGKSERGKKTGVTVDAAAGV